MKRPRNIYISDLYRCVLCGYAVEPCQEGSEYCLDCERHLEQQRYWDDEN